MPPSLHWLAGAVVQGVIFTFCSMFVNWLLRAKREKIKRDLMDAMMFGPMFDLPRRITVVLNKHYGNRFWPQDKPTRPNIAIVPSRHDDDTPPSAS